MTKEIRILGTGFLDSELYRFNEEYEGRHYCGKDFQKGWRVRIEIPKYKRKGTEFREGVVLNPEIIDTVMGRENPVLELKVEEEFRGRRNRFQPRAYSYYRILNAWLLAN